MEPTNAARATLARLSALGVLIRRSPDGRFGVWPAQHVPADLREQLAQHGPALRALAAPVLDAFPPDVGPLALWLQHAPQMNAGEPLQLGPGVRIVHRPTYRARLLSDLHGHAGARMQRDAEVKLYSLFGLLTATPALPVPT